MTPAPGPLSPDTRLRAEVVDRLTGGHASVTPEAAFAGLPPDRVDERPAGFVHSLWDLAEHLRVAQADILEFTRSPNYTERAWPEDYWPAGPSADAEWHATLAAFLADRDALVALVRDPATDLTAELPHAPGYTVLREALLAAEHTAHHLGQVVSLRRALGLWPPDAA